ncbi:MAG: DsbA family protein [Chloroflexi bacterium]|nr:MAG: DsbA family protein [Chloroflexota bacterium]
MSKRQELRVKRIKQGRIRRFLVIGGVMMMAIAVALIIILPNLPKPAGEIVQTTPGAHSQVKSASGRELGDPNAPLVIDVWEDFQCPSCKRFSEGTEVQIIDNLVSTGKVRYAFHVLAFIGPESVQAANAAMCANEQGRFWDYKSTLFANWNGENEGAFADDRLIAFAQSISLDMEKFRACFGENRYQAEIEKDKALGDQYGVYGTPSVLLNGEIINPDHVPSFDEISKAVEAALKK